MTEMDGRVDVLLTSDERRVLVSGLNEWGGPAACTEELAVAMGFQSVEDLVTQARRLRADLEQMRPLSALDWTRVLFATEIVFASDVKGSGVEWETTVGLSDDETIRLLRGLQRKLVALQAQFGTRPPRR